MKHTRKIFLSGLLGCTVAATSARAQSVGSAPDSVSAVPDALPVEGKKKGGLLGKAKKLAGNKAVQQVAKTVACTMVPGGQVVAGAIDAASSENVGEAAVGAAAGASGNTCMPAGMDGAAVGAGAMPAGTVGAELGLAGIPGSMLGGEAAVGSVGEGPTATEGGTGYDPMGDGVGSDEMAACMGLTPEEYLDFTDPTRGEARSPTKEEMKRQGKLARKVDMGRLQACVMMQAGRDGESGDGSR
jgi:hypothetical protein